MTNTNTNQFSTDPTEIGTTIVEQGRKVNGFLVIDMMPAPGRGGLIVLCFRDESPTRVPDFITWNVWRNEEGKIVAQSGHYDMTLEEGLADLHERAGSLAWYQTTVAAIERSY